MVDGTVDVLTTERIGSSPAKACGMKTRIKSIARGFGAIK